jgi:putative molybdopterin biosynthesis protein
MALKKNEAHIAPTHLLDEETGSYNVSFIERLLSGRRIHLINLVHRQQGLMTLKENPKNVTGFSDLAREDIVFINRQRGSGTRLLLDRHLDRMGINPDGIQGYDMEEYTHMAVASAVLTGVADTGLGVLGAANALGLHFIPVATERYDLAIPEEYLETDMLGALLSVIRDDRDFRAAVLALGGYDVGEMGKTMYCPAP